MTYMYWHTHKNSPDEVELLHVKVENNTVCEDCGKVCKQTEDMTEVGGRGGGEEKEVRREEEEVRGEEVRRR